MSEYKKKLIEVALPLEAINRESAREKSIRHGHPSTLHLWWARRPLASCRAVLFSQLVDDPSAHPDEFPTEEAQAEERQRLFRIIERLVVWENINDEALLREAHEEILKSTDGKPPTILDPFAGGGSIPLEAQRLGLEAHASDLNPVAVLINKALIEIPPKWTDKPPVSVGAAESKMTWPKATGLAEDVRRYGEWMRDEAEKRIGNLYPKATLADGTEAIVIAWIWSRTVKCPNPACGIEMPLVRSWWLGKKKGKEAYVVPHVIEGQVSFEIGSDPGRAPSKETDGTVDRTGARCVACGTAAPLSYVRDEGQAGRLGVCLLATAVEGNRRRHYLAPNDRQRDAAALLPPDGVPDFELSHDKIHINTPLYGMNSIASLFTSRQLIALTALSDLVSEVRQIALHDALAAGLPDDGVGLGSGGTGAKAYSESVAMYLAMAVSRFANFSNALCQWRPDAGKEQVGHLFARQAIPMVWDFAESNIFSDSAGGWAPTLRFMPKVLDSLNPAAMGVVTACDAATRSYLDVVVSTDPPYYDNIAYSNLSDFFYAWLRPTLHETFPDLFGTVQTPKANELVADQYRHGGKGKAAEYFEAGFNGVFSAIRRDVGAKYPITVFYAFKQSENDGAGIASTGWQTLLEGIMRARWEVTGTWPIRTELGNRMLASGTNALASSIVLVLRPRPDTAETVSRRSFVQALQAEMPGRLRELQQGSIAPVDLAQAAIGPGMSVFSRYSRVLEADGSEMTIRTALALINQALDGVLSEQEGDFDAETRFAVKWFSQHGWNEAPAGEADVLTRAVNTTLAMLERGGIFRAAAGRARLLEPSEMSEYWNPADDKAISVWEVAVRLGHALLTAGMEQASVWMRESASKVDLDAVKELSYLMYSVCERKGWAEAAMLFNALGTSWSDVAGAASSMKSVTVHADELMFGTDDD